MSFDKPIGIFVFDYAWILFILVAFLNAGMLKLRSNRIMKLHPELQDGYDQFIKGFLSFMNIPWIVLGIGMVFGGIPSTFSFFTPRHGNLFVIAFHVSVIILWLLGVWWIFFKGGAEFLVKYKGVFHPDIQSPLTVKLLFSLMLLGGVIGEIIFWSW